MEFDNGERSLTELLNAEEEYIQSAITLARARKEAIYAVSRGRAAEGHLTFP